MILCDRKIFLAVLFSAAKCGTIIIIGSSFCFILRGRHAESGYIGRRLSS